MLLPRTIFKSIHLNEICEKIIKQQLSLDYELSKSNEKTIKKSQLLFPKETKKKNYSQIITTTENSTQNVIK